MPVVLLNRPGSLCEPLGRDVFGLHRVDSCSGSRLYSTLVVSSGCDYCKIDDVGPATTRKIVLKLSDPLADRHGVDNALFAAEEL